MEIVCLLFSPSVAPRTATAAASAYIPINEQYFDDKDDALSISFASHDNSAAHTAFVPSRAAPSLNQPAGFSVNISVKFSTASAVILLLSEVVSRSNVSEMIRWTLPIPVFVAS